MKRAALALVGALLATGCATDRVTLLDNEDGSAEFAVAEITDPGKECVVDKQLSEQKLGKGCRPKTLAKIRDKDAALVSALPPKAREFVITFPSGQSKIPDSQRGVLEEIRSELSIRPGAQIEVAGFTDSVDDDAANDRYSRERAEAVAQELRDFGFPVDPRDAVGRGEDEAKRKLGDNVPSEVYRRAVVIIR